MLIARSLGPADLLEYDRTKLSGLLLEEGSPASHAAIVARALDIPCVGRLAGLRDRVSEGDTVIVDAEVGEAYLRPRPDVVDALQTRLAVRRAQRRGRVRAAARHAGLHPRRGEDHLLMNAGLAVDLEILAETGAEGIGLFRTEFQFMVSEDLPRINAQAALYARVLEAAGDLPVTFRTLDLGGDKVLPYLEAEREDNPALGWRAIRMGLDRPAFLKTAAARADRARRAAGRCGSCSRWSPASTSSAPRGRWWTRRWPGRSAAAARRPRASTSAR